MSNAGKDWISNKVFEVLYDKGMIDKAEKIIPRIVGMSEVTGWKNNERVAFVVWLDDAECEWKFERRELDDNESSCKSKDAY